MKTVSSLALVTAICVVIFWVFMPLRPASAQQGHRPLSNHGRFHGYVSWPLYCGIAKCNDTRAAAMARQAQPRAKKAQ
jgi:hypothetical protein